MPELPPTKTVHPDEANPCVGKLPTAVKWLCAIITISCLFFAARQLPVEDALRTIRSWIESLGVIGPVVYGLIYVIASLLLIPGSVLTLAAGGLFGVAKGMIVVSLASTTTAALALLVARYALRRRIEERAADSPKFNAMDNAIQEGGWRIVALLRMSPAIPFNLQNYFYGITSIRFLPCVLTSWIAMLPGTLLYVYAGYVSVEGLEAAAKQDASITTGRWIMLGLGLVATIAVTIYITRLAKRQLRKQAELGAGLDGETNATTDSPRAPCKRWTNGASIALIVALGAIATALAAPQVRRAIIGLFGPPRVVMKEAYVANSDGPRVDHSLFDQLLKSHVDDEGWVDYVALKSDTERLNRYLSQIAATDFIALDRNEKLALLINAYNAFTLKLIVEHYPLASIRDIPSDQRWNDQRWKIGELTLSLSEIENAYLRAKFIEPRMHFAINCASVGCPKLAQFAYSGKDIDEQLQAAALAAHQQDSRWFRYDAESERVYLTKIYDWYRGDFEQVAESIISYATRFSPIAKSAIDGGNVPEVTFLDYDWSLNEQ